jgi:hypothetical protein
MSSANTQLPGEVLSLDLQREVLVDTMYGGDETHYRDDVRESYFGLHHDLDKYAGMHGRDFINAWGFSIVSVGVGMRIEWSDEPELPILAVRTTPTQHVVATSITPADIVQTNINLRDYGYEGPNLDVIGRGEVWHPALNDVRLKLLDPSCQEIVAPQAFDADVRMGVNMRVHQLTVAE